MKTFLDMSDKDISDIVRILYQTEHRENILSITRLKDCIEVTMEAYSTNEYGITEKSTNNDIFVITEDGITLSGFIMISEISNQKDRRYQQFLFAKGLHWINQDNEFLYEEE